MFLIDKISGKNLTLNLIISRKIDLSTERSFLQLPKKTKTCGL